MDWRHIYSQCVPYKVIMVSSSSLPVSSSIFQINVHVLLPNIFSNMCVSHFSSNFPPYIRTHTHNEYVNQSSKLNASCLSFFRCLFFAIMSTCSPFLLMLFSISLYLSPQFCSHSFPCLIRIQRINTEGLRKNRVKHNQTTPAN